MNKFVILWMIFFNFTLNTVEFVLFTQPKTATHLLIPILTELTHKNCYWAPEFTNSAKPLRGTFEEAAKKPFNYLFSLHKEPWKRPVMEQVFKMAKKTKCFLHLHAPYSPVMEKYLKEKDCITFFIKRDPRDQIVSLLNHYKYIHHNDPEIEIGSSDEKKLLSIIRKESRIQTIHYMNWLKSSVCCVLDFEKLMGAHGGKATQSDAIKEVKKIAKALKLNLSSEELKKIYQKHFGHGWSFFKGKVGAWEEYFNEEHKTAIKEEIGDLLIELGFEQDKEW